MSERHPRIGMAVGSGVAPSRPFNPAIQGLRGLAALSVMLIHLYLMPLAANLWPTAFPAVAHCGPRHGRPGCRTVFRHQRLPDSGKPPAASIRRPVLRRARDARHAALRRVAPRGVPGRALDRLQVPRRNAAARLRDVLYRQPPVRRAPRRSAAGAAERVVADLRGGVLRLDRGGVRRLRRPVETARPGSAICRCRASDVGLPPRELLRRRRRVLDSRRPAPDRTRLRSAYRAGEPRGHVRPVRVRLRLCRPAVCRDRVPAGPRSRQWIRRPAARTRFCNISGG